MKSWNNVETNRKEYYGLKIDTFYSTDHTIQCCQFEVLQQDQTIFRERNHNHDNLQCFHLLPSHPRAHHTPSKFDTSKSNATNNKPKY